MDNKNLKKVARKLGHANIALAIGCAPGTVRRRLYIYKCFPASWQLKIEAMAADKGISELVTIDLFDHK